MPRTLKFLITDKKTRKELGEGHGPTRAEALLDLLHRALQSMAPKEQLHGIVSLSENGRGLCFVDDGLAEVPRNARLRRLLGDEKSVSFLELA